MAIQEREQAIGKRLWDRLVPLLIVLVGAAFYASSLGGTFLLDDVGDIVRNPRLRSLLPAAGYPLMTSRALVDLTFAFNYAVGGLNPAGYHIVSVAFHLASGVLLYGICRRTLALHIADESWNTSLIAAAVSGIWVVHPLTTAAVTYLAQRYEVMMGFFLMMTLYCVLRGTSTARSNARRGWYLGAVAACLLGTACKEVMVVAPVLVLLFDRIYLASSAGRMARERWGLYVGLALSWCLLVWLLAGAQPGIRVDAAFGMKASIAYLATQAEVIVHYLKLSVWPHHLCLDYAWPLAAGIGQVWPQFVFVTGLCLAVGVGLFLAPKLAFPGVYFLLVLAPTSSVIARPDCAFEHRMYLPLMAVVVCLMMWAYACLSSAGRSAGLRETRVDAIYIALAAGIIAVLGARTVARNMDYADPLAMWSKVAAARPQNFRARSFLASDLLARGKYAEAEAKARDLVQRVRLAPSQSTVHSNLIVQTSGRLLSIAHNILGGALMEQGRLDEAYGEFESAMQSDPGYPWPRYNEALLLTRMGRDEEARAVMRDLLKEAPETAEGRMFLTALREGAL